MGYSFLFFQKFHKLVKTRHTLVYFQYREMNVVLVRTNYWFEVALHAKVFY